METRVAIVSGLVLLTMVIFAISSALIGVYHDEKLVSALAAKHGPKIAEVGVRQLAYDRPTIMSPPRSLLVYPDDLAAD